MAIMSIGVYPEYLFVFSDCTYVTERDNDNNLLASRQIMSCFSFPVFAGLIGAFDDT